MIKKDKELLADFLKEFPKDSLEKKLTLQNYTNTGKNRSDFTYWVEWKLGSLGGIRGNGSYKFGIYKCKSTPKTELTPKPGKRKRYGYDKDNGYAWEEKYKPNGSYGEVFDVIKEKIIAVAEAASKDKIEYKKIEEIELDSAFKWKVAFLYSGTPKEKQNVRLVPVYQMKALLTAAERLDVLPVDSVTIAALQENLVEHFNTKSKEPEHSPEYNDIYSFGRYVWKIGNSDLSQSNQIIKYGAPGTGKTYTAKQEAKDFFEIWKLDAGNTTAEFDDHFKFVQFHPSYSYEDFIEGIKPVVKNGKTELELRNGVFKKFCQEAAKYEIWLLKKKIIQPYDKENGTQLSEICVADVKKKGDKNCPFDLPQSAKPNDPIVQYIPPYFFVIDEINRADLSRVFGELMYCLEYRGYEGRIKTQYSELESGDTVFYKDKDKNGENWFFIPNNVYIIGTMNTIDRSIESFDFALRRRFLWQRIDPNESVLQDYFEERNKIDFGEDIIPLWKELNDAIKKNAILGHDYQIGHSYLMKLDKYPNLSKTAYRKIIWEKHIKPILEEYFRGMGKEANAQIDTLENEFIPQTQNSKSTKAGNQNTNPETGVKNE